MISNKTLKNRMLIIIFIIFFNFSQLDWAFTMRICERLAPFTYFNFFCMLFKESFFEIRKNFSFAHEFFLSHFEWFSPNLE
jgi:hypothetical protein